MTDLPADVDDAGIFALVVLATIATAAAISTAGYSLWLVLPACAIYFVLGELAARRLAGLKARSSA